MLYPENVIWQSPDLSWNLGFYDAYTFNEEIGLDYESLNQFMYVSSGHSSPEEAENSWLATNLDGDGEIIHQDPTTQQEIAVLEQLKEEYVARKTHSFHFVLN